MVGSVLTISYLSDYNVLTSGSGGGPEADGASPRSPYRGDPERAHLDNSSNSPTDRSPLPQIAQRLWATRPEDATRLPPAVELGRTDAYCRGSEAAGNKPF